MSNRGRVAAAVRPIDGIRPRRAGLRAAAGLGMLLLLVLAVGGAFGGGQSTAGAAEVPAGCVEYQSLLTRCFGERAKKLPSPWLRNKSASPAALETACAEESRRLRVSCR
jgi:hypothetical protein